MVNQHLPHGARRYPKEMIVAQDSRVQLAQLKKQFTHQRRGLQRMPRTLSPQQTGRDAAQPEKRQPVERISSDAISQPSLLKQRCKCFGHRKEYIKSYSNILYNSQEAPMSDHDQHHDHQAVPSDPTLRVKALESLLVEKGLVDPAALDVLVDTLEHKVGPRNGARVVARAWVDPAYKKRLLADAPSAIAELGYTSGQGEHMLVLENGPKVHNLVVCTLCSCYPWTVLGLPPVWYKSAPYRSRSVIDPRGVLT